MFACCAADDSANDATAELGVPATAVVRGEEVAMPAPVVVKPAPEVGSFSVEVSTKGFDALGLKLDKLPQSGGHLIMAVEGAAVAAFNKETPTQSLKAYDVITAVDGAKGFEPISEKLKGKLPDTVTLEINRPQKVEMSLKKTGPMGIKMDYKDSSVGCVISEVNSSGLIAQWNTDNPGKRIGASDRIVEFNGKQVLGKDLLEMLKKEDKLPLTVLKY